jgi:uncharacterized membrane protein YfcA
MDITTIIIVSTIAFLLAGTIKGLSGLGLPSAAIAMMILVIDPRSAIALVMFPMIGTNIWQSYRGGHFLRTVRRYWLFAVILLVTVGITTILTRNVSDRGLLFALGIAISIFVIASWRNMVPTLDPKYDRAAQIGFALFSGGIGGMTAGWGAPLAMYLTTKGVPKDEFIRATGFLIIAGSIPLTIGYAQIGYLTGDLMWISLAMLIPTIIGFSIGENLRARLTGSGFRNVLLIVFGLLALNMFRRAIWYIG